MPPLLYTPLPVPGRPRSLSSRQVTGTLFYGGAYPDSASFSGSGGLPGGDSLADGFHNFTLEWDLTEMRW